MRVLSVLNVMCLGEVFDGVREISLLRKKSPRKNTKFEEISNQIKNDS